MAYTPPRQKSQFDIGDRVVGKMRFVKANGKKAIKVLWHEEGQTRSQAVLLEKCFEEVQEDLKQIYSADYDGEFLISFNTDKSAIVNFHPINQQIKVRVKEFPAKEGEDPKPKVYTGKWGDMVKFTTILEIVDSKLKGLTLPLQLFYEKFVPIEGEGGETVTGFSSPPGNSKHCDALSDFCDATSVWEFGPIPWKQNILPELQKRILRLEREFNVVVGKEGWIENIYPIYDYDEEEQEEVVSDDGEPPWEETEETIDINDAELSEYDNKPKEETDQEESEMIDPDWD